MLSGVSLNLCMCICICLLGMGKFLLSITTAAAAIWAAALGHVILMVRIRQLVLETLPENDFPDIF